MGRTPGKPSRRSRRGGRNPVKRSLAARGLHAVFGRINKKRQWYEVPTTPLRALNLLSLRLDLRDFNLFDTSIPIRKRGGEGEVDYDFANTETHWWDGSQIYGATPEKQASLRSFKDGKLKLTDDDRLLEHETEAGVDRSGFTENWWFGLSCLHTLFSKEHNAICDVLKRENPRWDDQRLFDTAWLINAALMAKIHTVEWTPGIVNTGALWFAMNVNWSGIFGQNLKDRFGRLGDSELFSGIMGSPQEHHDARFQLTEEFVSVYRMHPLVLDDWNLFEHKTGRLVEQKEFVE